MILISSIPVKRSIITDFFIRNIELSYPYDVSRIIGTHGLKARQEPRLQHQPFVELINLGCCCVHPEFLQASINVPCVMLSKLITTEVPSVSRVPKEDVFWSILGEILDMENYEPFIENEMYDFVNEIMIHYRQRDSIIDMRGTNGGYVVKDTHIRFPKYNVESLPMGYTFNLEVLIDGN